MPQSHVTKLHGDSLTIAHNREDVRKLGGNIRAIPHHVSLLQRRGKELLTSSRLATCPLQDGWVHTIYG